MKDLARLNFERREHYFEQLQVVQLVLNPKVTGYPEVFLICTESKGSQQLEYALGLNLGQWNNVMMKAMDNTKRSALSESIADMLRGDSQRGCELKMQERLGAALTVKSACITTRLRKFITEKPSRTRPLYYYELTHFEPLRA